MVERWIERWRRRRDRLGHLERPYKLVLAALLPLIAVAILEGLFAAQQLNWLRDWIGESAYYGPLFFPAEAEIEWKDRLQGMVLLLGLPVAFCLWHWRDRNVRDQIENHRKDTNLREFQELQLRAAGAISTDFPEKSRQTLWISALHQLRGYLRGEYGGSFKRPAFEVYCALLSREKRSIKSMQEKIPNAEPDLGLADSVYLTVRIIVQEESNAFFRGGFPLTGRSFDEIELRGDIDLSNLDFSGSTFRRSTFFYINLSSSTFNGCNFEDASFDICDLGGSTLFQCEIGGLTMSHVSLDGAKLLEMDPSKLKYLVGCEYDSETKFGRGDSEPQLAQTDISNEEARANWTASGLQMSNGSLDLIMDSIHLKSRDRKK